MNPVARSCNKNPSIGRDLAANTVNQEMTWFYYKTSVG